MKNNSLLKRLLFTVLLMLFIYINTVACSTFALIKGKSILVCNNDDWFSDVGYMVVNPRGMKKQTFLPFSTNKIEWVSKYGSVTLNFNFIGDP